MKKSIVIATLLTLTVFLTSFSASAQRGYRGFVDAEIGALIYDGDAYSGIVALGTSHGYQLNNWFIGAGADIYISNSDPFLPIYVKLRYDFSLISDKSFYAALKAGYETKCKAAFAAPSVGLRKTINNGHTLNFGLNINIIVGDFLSTNDTEIAPTISVGYEF